MLSSSLQMLQQDAWYLRFHTCMSGRMRGPCNSVPGPAHNSVGTLTQHQ